MNYLPILDELLSSDSVIFMVIGLVIALITGIKMKDTKKNLLGAGVNLAIYGVCELFSNFSTNFLIELILLFIGTIAIGGFVGFLIGLIISKVRK